MPRGANAKREREYNELKSEFEKEHRYKGREEEVAARIVNKQRSRFGETKREKKKDREGKSPDRDLPIKQYQHKTIAQVERAMEKLSKGELQEIERYEKKHKNRKTLLETIKEQIKGGAGNSKNGGSSRSRSSGSSSTSSSRSKSSRVSSSSTRSKKTSPSSRGKAGASKKSASSSTSRSSKAGRSKTSAASSHTTTDHDEIRQWVEGRGGHPATVRSTVGNGHEPGILRIDFPGYSGEGSLEEITWDEFFDKFEESKLAFLYQKETAGGKKSNFNKLVSR